MRMPQFIIRRLIVVVLVVGLVCGVVARWHARELRRQALIVQLRIQQEVMRSVIELMIFDITPADPIGWSSTEADDGPFGSLHRAAFLYRDSTMLDLNRLMSPASGWTLTEARAINDRGQVVGDGQPRGFLLTAR